MTLNSVLHTNPNDAETVSSLTNTEPSSLVIAGLDSNMLGRLNRLQLLGFETGRNVLELCHASGLIDLTQRKRMVDFGAGMGGPTLALSHISRQYGGVVEAVEKSPESANTLIETGILPAEHIHTEDGIEYLRRRADDDDDEVDLITAFMFGDDSSGELARQFLSASRDVLASGKLLVCSDVLTMSAFRRACENSGAKYDDVVKTPYDTPNGAIPSTIVVSFN